MFFSNNSGNFSFFQKSFLAFVDVNIVFQTVQEMFVLLEQLFCYEFSKMLSKVTRVCGNFGSLHATHIAAGNLLPHRHAASSSAFPPFPSLLVSSSRLAIGLDKMLIFFSFLCHTLKSDIQSEMLSRPSF